MSSYDFIIDGLRHSFSSISTFETCPYSFKLNYIDRIDGKEENFFSQFGNVVHDCMFQFFRNGMEAFELSAYFAEQFDARITACPPPFPAGMAERYRQEGLDFFNNFAFDLDNFEVILTEDKIDFELADTIAFVAKPDLVLLDKVRSNFLLVDYKTSAPFKINKYTQKETVDKKKIDSYQKQLYLYAYALRNYRFTPIDNMLLWFPRQDRKLMVKWKETEENDALAWAQRHLADIKAEEEFPANNKDTYFCNNLCNVRSACEYRPSL